MVVATTPAPFCGLGERRRRVVAWADQRGRRSMNRSEGFIMRNCGCVGVGVLGLVLCGTASSAQDLGRYRQFELGSDVAVVSTVTGTAASDLKVIHHRPALIQELTWRPRYGVRRPGGSDTESVEQVTFGFYDDQLFRVTVDYDREQTEGLIDADMVEAISAVYGPQVKPAVSRRRQTPSMHDDPGTLLAQWGNVDNSVMLYRLSSYATSFRLVVAAEPIAALARTAAARALVLDAREAPQREAAREKKEADDRRAAEEKARSTNKATFRP
jgi:hypothetical protein